MSNFYLDRFGFQKPVLTEPVCDDLSLIVVIPCYNEPNLIRTLQSLNDCEISGFKVEVIVVINASELDSDLVYSQNAKTSKAFDDWVDAKKDSSNVSYFKIEHNAMPKKHAGVGLARKIGMDEAVYRFDTVNKNGVIVCLDADSQVPVNYLITIKKHFDLNVKSPGCSIHYEHPTEGEEFDDAIYSSIVEYELFLRYYRQGLVFANLPYAYHTIGSSMAVRSLAYQKQGGMNKRKAGEDFYFLNKIVKLGGFTEITETHVIPSPRTSDRVPFGTGKAVLDALARDNEVYLAYSFNVFKDLKVLVDNHIRLFADTIDLKLFQESVVAYLKSINGFVEIEKIAKNVSSEHMFTQQFFNWFDAFKALKFIHFATEHFYKKVPLKIACIDLLKSKDALLVDTKCVTKDLLKVFRTLDLNTAKAIG